MIFFMVEVSYAVGVFWLKNRAKDRVTLHRFFLVKKIVKANQMIEIKTNVVNWLLNQNTAIKV